MNDTVSFVIWDFSCISYSYPEPLNLYDSSIFVVH